MDALLEAGAVGFTDDGIPLMNGQLVMEAMEKAAALDVPLSFHEEDPSFIRNNGINRGAVSEKLGNLRLPRCGGGQPGGQGLHDRPSHGGGGEHPAHQLCPLGGHGAGGQEDGR